ncbi:MAG: glycerol-3-phosphate acyltransferase [Solimicrobium sp.]|jgi:glycerol-3-phosphate acyltransferase PlsY|nr:glycerol-3-phosphate acyltransferase [Solimicrobium sp.]
MLTSLTPNLAFVSISVVILSYLIGSISFAVIVSKLMGLSDPRTYGSQNPGATNVLRSGHKPAAILTLMGDGFKGWMASWLAMALHLPEPVIALAAIAVFIGHLWPVFFKFAGGKGVATAAGVLLGLDPWLGLGTLITWLVVFFCFRYSSLAALIAALFAPFYSGLIFGTASALFWATCVMSALLIFRHKNNIQQLISGKETRFSCRNRS